MCAQKWTLASGSRADIRVVGSSPSGRMITKSYVADPRVGDRSRILQSSPLHKLSQKSCHASGCNCIAGRPVPNPRPSRELRGDRMRAYLGLREGPVHEGSPPVDQNLGTITARLDEITDLFAVNFANVGFSSAVMHLP